MINTVRGPVPVSDLGTVLCHEHFIFGYPGFQGDSTWMFDKEAFLEKCGTIIKELKQYGLKTIIDATPNDSGRDVLLLREISERFDIHIICCTGYYYESEGATAYLKTYNTFMGDASDHVYDIMKKELYEGVGGTNIKAGVIKLSTGEGNITEYESWQFKAAARLACEDPAIRIITHTQKGQLGLEQAAFLVDAGVDARHIAIGHIDCNTDISVLMDILELGCYLSFDRFGLEGDVVGSPHDSRRMALVIGLAGMGYGDRIMISHDYSLKHVGALDLTKNSPNWSWTHIFKNILPGLADLGVESRQIHQLMNENPQSFYG
jgi:phosphotriesterase-related protein